MRVWTVHARAAASRRARPPVLVPEGFSWGAFLFALPWLDRSPVKSIRYRGPKFKIALALFVIAFVGLGVLGILPATELYTWIARVL